MNSLVKANQNFEMNSVEFLEQVINPARELKGEKPARYADFFKRVMDETEKSQNEIFVMGNGGKGRDQKAVMLTQDDMLDVGMRESKAVRKSVRNTIKELTSKKESTFLQNLSPEALIMLEDLNKQLEHQKAETQRLNHNLNLAADQFKEGLKITDFCKQLNGVNIQKVQSVLAELGMLQFSYGKWRVTSYARDKYFTERPTAGYETHTRGHQDTLKIVVLKKGAKWIYSQYLKGNLPMKATFNGEYTHKVF